MTSRISPDIRDTGRHAECAVLGAILLNPQVVSEVVELLEPRHFAELAYRCTYGAMLRLHRRKEPIDQVTVQRELEAVGDLDAAGGSAALTQLEDNCPTAANAGHYASIVRRAGLQRQLALAAKQIAGAARGGEDLGGAIRNVISAATDVGAITSEDLNLQLPRKCQLDVLTREDALARYDARKSAAVVPTGIAALDEVIGGGWPVGQDSVVLGYSGSGKSEIARHTARYAAQRGHGVVHVDIELGVEQIVQRDLAQLSGISPRRLREGRLTADELGRLRKARAEIAADTRTRTICPGGAPLLTELDTAIELALSEIATDLPSLLVFDSLQRIAAGAEGDTQRLQTQHAMWWLAAVAQRYGAAVVIISEQARAREGGTPTAESILTSGAESRSIEYVADVVVGLVPRQGPTSEDAHSDTSSWERRVGLAVAKNRHGATGHVSEDLVFQGPCWKMGTEPRDADLLEEKILEALTDLKVWPSSKIVKRVGRRKQDVLAKLRDMLDLGAVEHVVDDSGRPLGWKQRFPEAGTSPPLGEVPRGGNPPEPRSGSGAASSQNHSGSRSSSEVPATRNPGSTPPEVPVSPYVIGGTEPEVTL